MRRCVVLGVAVLLATACGGGSDPVTTAASSSTSVQISTTTTIPPTVATGPRAGLPEGYPAELIPPGVTAREWMPTGAGTDVFFETSSGFEEMIDFYTNALEPPLDVRTEDGVERAIWVYKPGVEHIAVIVESDGAGVQIKVSGLF